MASCVSNLCKQKCTPTKTFRVMAPSRRDDVVPPQKVQRSCPFGFAVTMYGVSGDLAKW